jgi:hypothetical protein
MRVQAGLSNKDSRWELWGTARFGEVTSDIGQVGGLMRLQAMNGIWAQCGQFRGSGEEAEGERSAMGARLRMVGNGARTLANVGARSPLFMGNVERVVYRTVK